MLTYEYKCEGSKKQYAAIEEAIRIVQFIRNKCLCKWMDSDGTTSNDLQCYCAVLAQEYSFAARLNSQARQASADRAWFAIARFYDNCKTHKPGKKGYPQFQHDNRSVEYNRKPIGSYRTLGDRGPLQIDQQWRWASRLDEPRTPHMECGGVSGTRASEMPDYEGIERPVRASHVQSTA